MIDTSFPHGEMQDAVELGAIDHQSVRVWTRWPSQEPLRLTLTAAGREPVLAELQPDAASDWTAAVILALSEPAPNMPFTIEAGRRTLTGRFAPIPGTPASLTFGFGSCHMPYAEEDHTIVVRPDDAAIYPAIARDLRTAEASLLLLTGDQIYADERPGISVRDDLGQKHSPPSLEVALEAYRRNYRGFFNEPGFRRLREGLPTLCMWDDHDIFDNWGSSRAKSPLDLRLFEAAIHAYAEYQHPRNPGASTSQPPFGWTMEYGDIGILGLDVRGKRDAESGTMLGQEQWRTVQEYLRGEESRHISTLFVASSVPVAHVARWFTMIFDLAPERFTTSIRDRWNAGQFIESRDDLLDALFDWQTAVPHRQVIILSGDVHSASAFTIRQRNGPGVIRQVTSSAMTTPLVVKQMAFNRVVVHGTNLFEKRYAFERHFLSISHNIGIARVERRREGGHRVALTVRRWQPRLGRLRTDGRLVVEPE